jgi:hypothetical protein
MGPPAWAVLLVFLGGVVTYIAAGILLEGFRFLPDLASFLEHPEKYLGGDPERAAPFVLLLIPAVLGGLGTMTMIRMVVVGRRRGQPLSAIAKGIAGFLASSALLVLVALFTSGKSVR